MSNKTVIAIGDEIRKSFATGNSTRISLRPKPDFKLKQFQSPKNPFGVAAMCADGGTVFSAIGSKD